MLFRSFSDTESYGVSWRTEGTGGHIKDSDVSHMYFGVYTFGVGGLEISGNDVHDSTLYGIDPHTGSHNLKIENNIEIERITEPLKIFEGSAREAAKGFPANLNVAVALSLAGIGPDRTRLEIWADPGVMRNVHRVEVDSDSARFSMSIENIPSENPKTGLITALSVIAYLRKLRAPLRIGT